MRSFIKMLNHFLDLTVHKNNANYTLLHSVPSVHFLFVLAPVHRFCRDLSHGIMFLCHPKPIPSIQSNNIIQQDFKMYSYLTFLCAFSSHRATVTAFPSRTHLEPTLPLPAFVCNESIQHGTRKVFSRSVAFVY